MTHQDAVAYLLMVYSESTKENIEKLEQKLKSDNEKLDEDEENILYFKGHLEEFFLKNHADRDLTKEDLIEIVKGNVVL